MFLSSPYNPARLSFTILCCIRIIQCKLVKPFPGTTNKYPLRNGNCLKATEEEIGETGEASSFFNAIWNEYVHATVALEIYSNQWYNHCNISAKCRGNFGKINALQSNEFSISVGEFLDDLSENIFRKPALRWKWRIHLVFNHVFSFNLKSSPRCQTN